MTHVTVPRWCLLGGGAWDGLARESIGAKAANLALLHRLGLRVPPAVALTSALCREYLDRGCLPSDFDATLASALSQLEIATGLSLGGARPLIVSVRSSPPASMPGMLGTLLDVGMTEDTISGLVRRTGNPRLAWDAYRRLLRGLGEASTPDSVAIFDRLEAEQLSAAGARDVQELDALSMRALARACETHLPPLGGRRWPLDATAQIAYAVECVLRSWSSPRAREYRRLSGLDDATGTAVLIQAMVFGNSGPRSGTGVGFTRNPTTGERELYVDFVFGAQGEDVVSGRRPVTDGRLLPAALPQVWGELLLARDDLERELRDMQDFEFTVEDGRLYFLQTRPGKRTPWAALRMATDMVQERLIEPAVALERLAPYDLGAIVRTGVAPSAGSIPLAHATSASVGGASGRIVFDAVRARQASSIEPVIFVQSDLSTDDLPALAAASGVLTTFGGRTSHAAVVARQLGKVCLVGCRELRVDAAARACTIGSRRFVEGDVLTLDGDTGFVYEGRQPVVTERPDGALALVDGWRMQAVSR